MKVSDFEFDLPDHLIARYPARKRTDSRLLHLNKETGDVGHHHFRDMLDFIGADDLLVFNNTRVIPARFYGNKETGGRVEILLERVVSDTTALAQIRASKSPGAGTTIQLENDGAMLQVGAREGEFFQLTFPAPGVLAIAAAEGHMPLPPYIDRKDESLDEDRYQTVYASREGAVAAPTAGLHFDEALITRLLDMGVQKTEVTLHVGAGTFQPVRVDAVEDHQMHKEYVEVSAENCDAVSACRDRGGRVIAVGTTSVRSLETASQSGVIAPFFGDTDIFIYPGYQFVSVDALITNFHLPGSTLMMLVSALAGREEVFAAYQSAIANEYRFFSYGDAMLIA